MNPSIFVSVPIGYQEENLHTEVVRYDNFVRRLLKADTEKVEALHWALGLSGEVGELTDAVKKEYIYNKPRDLGHIIEELGDIEWYLQCVYNHYNLTRQEVIQLNGEKLAKRYAGLVYSDAAAQLRADKET